MAGRRFVGFHLDIGIGDTLIEPTDRIEGEGWFDFAGLPRPEFFMISSEQQFAEKLHASHVRALIATTRALRIWLICFC